MLSFQRNSGLKCQTGRVLDFEFHRGQIWKCVSPGDHDYYVHFCNGKMITWYWVSKWASMTQNGPNAQIKRAQCRQRRAVLQMWPRFLSPKYASYPVTNHERDLILRPKSRECSVSRFGTDFLPRRREENEMTISRKTLIYCTHSIAWRGAIM